MNSLRSKKRKPTHPGALVREDVLNALKMSQTELALRLGVSRKTISAIVHERIPITVDVAIRLAHFLGTTPNIWLNMQQQLDIWELEHNRANTYKQIKRYA